MSHDRVIQAGGARTMTQAQVHKRRLADPIPIKPGKRRELISPRLMNMMVNRVPQKFADWPVTELGDRMVEFLPRLRRFATSLTHDQTLSEDLVQETCARALERLDQWQPGSRLDSWMYRIAQNLWIDQLRTQKARREIVDIAAVGEFSDCDGRLVTETRLDILELRKCIAQLPSDQQALIRLVCVDGLSYREAAETLNFPTGTVMSRLARARVALSRMMDAERSEERK